MLFLWNTKQNSKLFKKMSIIILTVVFSKNLHTYEMPADKEKGFCTTCEISLSIWLCKLWHHIRNPFKCTKLLLLLRLFLLRKYNSHELLSSVLNICRWDHWSFWFFSVFYQSSEAFIHDVWEEFLSSCSFTLLPVLRNCV